MTLYDLFIVIWIAVIVLWFTLLRSLLRWLGEEVEDEHEEGRFYW